MLFRYELSPGMAHLSARIKSDIEIKRNIVDKNWIGLKFYPIRMSQEKGSVRLCYLSKNMDTINHMLFILRTRIVVSSPSSPTKLICSYILKLDNLIKEMLLLSPTKLICSYILKLDNLIKEMPLLSKKGTMMLKDTRFLS